MHSDFSTRISDPARLEALAATGMAEGPVPEAISRLVGLAARSLATASSAFLILEEKGFAVRGSFGLPETLSDLAVWPKEWTFLLDAAFGSIATDAPAMGGFPSEALPAFLGAPVADAQDRCLGVLALWDAKPRQWTPSEKATLGDFAACLRDLLAGRSASRLLARGALEDRNRIPVQQAFTAFRTEIDAVLNTLDTPVMAFSREGVAIFANQAAAGLLGYANVADLLHSKPSDISDRFDVLDEFLRPYPRERLPTLRALRGETVAGELVCFRRKATGVTKWTYVKATPVFDAEGRVRLVITVNQDVTGIKTAEMEIQKSRHQLEIVLSGVDDAIFLTDITEGRKLVYANQAAARLMEFPSVEELLREGVEALEARLTLTDEAGGEIPIELNPDRLAARGEFHPPALIRLRVNPGGAERWVVAKSTPIFGSDGTVHMVVNILHDMTEVRRAEESVAKHLRYLEGMNQVSGAIERTLDVERVLPAAMGRLLEVFECDRAWLIHSGDSEASGYRIPFSAERNRPGAASAQLETIPADAGFEVIALACTAAEDPVVFGRDQPLPNAAYWRGFLGVGSAKAISVRPQAGAPWILCLLRPPDATPWKSEDLTLFRDISSRIATALGAMLLYRDMRRSEEKYRTLFERSLDGIFRCAPDGALLDANPALVAMLGYEDRAQLVDTIQPRLLPAGGDPHGLSGGGDTFAVELPRRDGTPVWVEVNAQPIRRAGGDIAYFEGIVRNINDRKRAEEQLKASEEKLRQSQKMEAVGRLAGGVAHDFNNLLTAINGFSDLLLMSFPKDDNRRNHLEEIRRAGSRAAALTSQLLSFSRKQVLAPRLLDMNAVVAGMETMLRRLIGENIEFRTRLGPKLPKVVADPNQMEQVILNLVLNARDAMPGGGELVVGTSASVLKDENRSQAMLEAPAGEYAVLTVEDTGTGMDGETKSRLFEPFFTTKQKDKGTGLGLSTVYGAVKQANGTITVESAPDRGTLFSIYLPAASKHEKPEKARLREKALRSMGGTETILLVEDEDAVRRLVRDVLEVGGYKVLEAPGGEQALDLVAAKEIRIHLLLTDVVMGGISGRVLAEKLQITRPEIKVLFMSGYTEDAIIRHGVYTAQAAFIGKPFSPAAISAKVREVLDGPAEKDAAGKEAAVQNAPDGASQNLEAGAADSPA